MSVDSLVIKPLPDAGVMTIGRSRAADVRLSEPRAAARHLRMTLGDRLWLEDLGGRAGTCVAGTPLAARSRVELLPGEPIAIGGTVLMVREPRVEERPQRIWAHAAFESRLQDECDRARRGPAHFAVIRLSIERDGATAAPAAEADPVLARLAAFAPPPHAVGVYAGREYELLLVGAQPASAHERLAALTETLVRCGYATRAGIATFPADGRTGAGLLAEAGRRLFQDQEADPVWSLADEKAIARAAAHDGPLVLVGEAGTGKRTFAQAVHDASARVAGRFRVLEVAGRSVSELERVLFGSREEEGLSGTLYGDCQGGTLYLAESDAEDPTGGIAARLAEGMRRRASVASAALDPALRPARLIVGRSITGNDAIWRPRAPLAAAERISFLSLRQRPEHWPSLFNALVTAAARARDVEPLSFNGEIATWMARRSWPGNLRELASAIDRAVAADAMHRGRSAARDSAQRGFAPHTDPTGVVAEVVMQKAEIPCGTLGGERERILAALSAFAFNQSRAAAHLGMSRRTLVARLNQFGIERPLKSAVRGEQSG